MKIVAVTVELCLSF